MSAVDTRTTSGVFIRPVWRPAPWRGELAIALVLAVVPVIGLLCLTAKLGDRELAENAKPASNPVVARPARRPASVGALALAALSAPHPQQGKAQKGEADGGAPAAKRVKLPSTVKRFLIGRRSANRDLNAEIAALKVAAVNVPAHIWVKVILLVLLGPLFCFFAWPLRRAATAMLGAYVFGAVAFEVAVYYDMQWTGALVVCLAPAFLGALVGWHLLVACTTINSGCITGATVGVALITNFGAPSWLPAPVIILLCCSLAIALVYLLALRPALISGWATLGSGLMSAALVVGLGMFVQRLPLWDLFLACFALLVITGTITQYRLGGTGEGEGEGDGDGDLAAEAASTAEGRAMLRRLRLEHEGAE
jgi:hypothetical protein